LKAVDFKTGGVIAGAAFAVLLTFSSFVPSDSACATCACHQYLCESEEGLRARERKKAWALRRGLPPRLAALFDRIPPCMYCVENMPDWPFIEWEFDADGYEAAYGRPPPYDRRGLTWTRDMEQRIRDDMRKGIVSKFTIHLGGYPCRCCPPLDEDGNDISDEKYYASQPGWDEDFRVHPDAGFLYTDPEQAGADPADLTELPASFRRPDELDFPEVRLPDPVRVVQPLCQDCWPIADEYNDVGRKINELNRLRARKQRDLYILNQVINGIWREMEGVSGLSSTPETQQQYQDLLDELSARQNDRIRDKEEIREIGERVAELHAKLAQIMARLAECEENCERAVEEGKVLIGDNGERSLFVPAGLRPITGSCPPCTELERQHNTKVGELNNIRQKMLELAQRYLAGRDARIGILDEYEQLIKPFTEAEAQATALRAQLDECLQRCEASDGDQIGIGDDGNPFDGALGPAADDTLMGGSADDRLSGAVGQACGQFLSVPADTIACSVHTFKKPDLGQGNPNPDVTFGETTAVPESEGNGFDTDVFIRHPDDNNLREGCGDLTPNILINDFNFPPVPAQEIRVVPIACNKFANGDGDRAVIIRKGPEKYDVDTSERRRADYTREENERFKKTGESTMHLTVRNLVNDAVATGTDRVTCPRTETDDGINYSDPKFADVPDSVKNTVAGVVDAVQGDENIDRIKGAIQAIDQTDETLSNLGVQVDKFHKGSQAAQAGMHLAESVVKVQSGESLTTEDAKKAAELVAEITDNDAVQTVAQGFDVAVKLQELALKREQGINVETSDITELVDKLDTLRGDRFEELGEVLGGIKKNSERIEKAEEVIEQLGKAADFLELARDGQSDPVKAFEAFGEYLEMLGSIAGKVPGMGEFVEKYAEAVKAMQKDVEAIAAGTLRTNEAIAAADEAIGGYDYDKLKRDAQQFDEDLDEEGGGGTRYSADQLNLWRQTADERYEMDEAQREVRRLEDCIKDCRARMQALKNLWNELNKEYKSLPPQSQLKQELQEASFKSIYFEQYQAAAAAGQRWVPTAQDLKNMGESSALEVESEFGGKSGFTTVKASKAINEARRRLKFRQRARERKLELKEEYRRLKKKLEDCEKRLPTAMRDYWQAVRDFVAEHSYWSAFIQDQKYSTADAQKARANALALIDQQIIAMGFGLTDGVVEIITVTVCEEDAVLYTTGQ